MSPSLVLQRMTTYCVEYIHINDLVLKQTLKTKPLQKHVNIIEAKHDVQVYIQIQIHMINHKFITCVFKMIITQEQMVFAGHNCIMHWTMLVCYLVWARTNNQINSL